MEDLQQREDLRIPWHLYANEDAPSPSRCPSHGVLMRPSNERGRVITSCFRISHIRVHLSIAHAAGMY
jgi:hypothetical protein